MENYCKDIILKMVNQKALPSVDFTGKRKSRHRLINRYSPDCLASGSLSLRLFTTFILLMLFFYPSFSHSQEKGTAPNLDQRFLPSNIETDIVVFDSSPAGIIAAISAANEGRRVVMITEDRHVGGMRTSGLSMSNVGEVEAFGGLGREFHDRVYQYYLDKYGADSEQVEACEEGFRFEPHVGEKIFLDWLLEAGVEILSEEYIESVQKEGTKIISVQTDRNRRISASVFIDASYEGDLFKMAGCSYRVGREGKDEYGESFAGMTFPPEKAGQADDKTQRYVYRVCLTDVPENQVPFSKPANYHRASYMIDAAEIRSNPSVTLSQLITLNMLPNRKTDARIGEWIGGSFAFPEATRRERQQIEKEHREYAQGYLWFLLTDDAVPQEVKEELAKWGYAKDEFVDNDHWPYHIYVREARRLVGEYVMTERDVLEDRFKSDGVGIGSYRLDVHPVQYVKIPDAISGESNLNGHGGIVREGGISHHLQPYEISFRALLAKRNEAENLLVPLCLSSSHIAYSTIRMEPVYMMLGHASGLAAAMSLDQNVSVHDLPIQQLRSRLTEQKAVLDAKPFQK